MQCGVQRPLFNEQRPVRRRINPLGDRVPMSRSPRERFQNEEVDALAENVQIHLGHIFPLLDKGIDRIETPCLSRGNRNRYGDSRFFMAAPASADSSASDAAISIKSRKVDTNA